MKVQKIRVDEKLRRIDLLVIENDTQRKVRWSLSEKDWQSLFRRGFLSFTPKMDDKYMIETFMEAYRQKERVEPIIRIIHILWALQVFLLSQGSPFVEQQETFCREMESLMKKHGLDEVAQRNWDLEWSRKILRLFKRIWHNHHRFARRLHYSWRLTPLGVNKHFSRC